MGDRDPLLDGALGKHIRLADKVALIVQHLQGGQEEVGAVHAERGAVGAGVDPPVLVHKGVVKSVQLPLLGLNVLVGPVLGLVLNERPHTVPYADQPLDAVGRCHGHLYRVHAAVFPVVHLAVHDGIAEIPYLRVRGDGLVLALGFRIVHDILGDGALDTLNSNGKLVLQVPPLNGQAGGFRPIGAADLPHFAHDHLRVVNKILVHFQPVGVGVQVYPIRFLAGEGVPLLQKEDVAGHIRSRGVLESVVGQADGPQQVGALGKVLPHSGGVLVHRALAGDKGDDTARPDLIQRPGKEVVVNEEIVSVIPLVDHLEGAEGHIPDGGVKKAVREVCFFKPLDSDRRLLIELLGDAA